MDPIRLFVGYDAEQALAPAVFAHSVRRRASLPVSVTELHLEQLRGIFARPRDPAQSTAFAFTRFLVPWLCGYEGWALFCDGDMICRADLAELWALRDGRCAVQVVRRALQAPAPGGVKFLGRAQSVYPRKNWSSVMLFNCGRCMKLTPDYVAQAPGLELHQFGWVLHDEDIGDLPGEWNHLVGVDAPSRLAKLVHYTLGMPWWSGLRECEYAAEWREERDALMTYAGTGEA